MKKTLVVLALVAVVLSGCKKSETAVSGTTETIAPAEPKPGTTDSDAMTQTVDIEDSRSEAEGGTLNNPTTAKTDTTRTTENPTTSAAPPTTTTR